VSASKIQLKHPDPAKSAPRISAEKYEAVKSAVLRAVAQNENGILFKDLPSRVSELLSTGQLENLGSVGWYTTTVKLDLEARGLIERVPGSSPQRLRMLE
jgi:hypothetical protein